MLLIEGMADPDELKDRIELMPIDDGRKADLKRWVTLTAEEL